MTSASCYPTVGDIVTRQPETARIFERLGIDYCCGGKRPLSEACADRGLDAQVVLDELAADEQHPHVQERNWSDAGLTDLCDHIEATHHAYMRDELPRLSAMV